MSLIKCKECGAMVSEDAKQCPNCGANLTNPVGVGIGNILGAIIISIVGITTLASTIKHGLGFTVGLLGGGCILLGVIKLLTGIGALLGANSDEQNNENNEQD